jgi:hypothetical protein
LGSDENITSVRDIQRALTLHVSIWGVPIKSHMFRLYTVDKIIINSEWYEVENSQARHWCDPQIFTDYRCKDGRYTVPASCMTISNPYSLSSSVTAVDPGLLRISWK